MSSNDYFNNRFPLKKRNIVRSTYQISNYVIQQSSNVFQNTIINDDIMNIIKNYFIPRKSKLLTIAYENIYTIKQIDDDITCVQCINLNLSDLPQYVYDAKNLISLDCSFNKIRKFSDERIFENLLLLNCSFNQIQELPKNMNQLKELYVNYNFLSNLTPLPNVSTISCIHNNIHYIDKQLFPKLRRFYSYWNSLSLDKISKKINKITRSAMITRSNKNFTYNFLR